MQMGVGDSPGESWPEPESDSFASCAYFLQAIFPVPVRPHCKTPVSSKKSRLQEQTLFCMDSSAEKDHSFVLGPSIPACPL
jgi:hypothetical protein